MHITTNPYLRIVAKNRKSSIMMQDESKRIINMCRCCGKPNAPYVYSNC